jgi:hypothetical protein
MNTAPTTRYSDDMENATLLQKNTDASKKNASSSSSSMTLKNVACGLGIVALACSGSFVAGRSAARYKLSSAAVGSSASTQLGVAARLGSSSATLKTKKHSTAHLAAGKKAAKKAASEEDETNAAAEEEDAPADPESMTKEEMAAEIKQLRGYMTSLVDEDEVRMR